MSSFCNFRGLPLCLVAMAASTWLPLLCRAGMVTDDFNAVHDYAQGNVSGTIWDGVLNAGQLQVGDASITQTGQLTWSAKANSGIEPFGLNNAPVLYRNVSGDYFDASVYIPAITTIPWSDGGLIVRDPLSGQYVQFRHFGAGNFNAVRASNGFNTNLSGFDPWLRIVRNGNAFEFYSKPSDELPWSLQTTYNFAPVGAADPVQVGLWFGTFGTGTVGTVRFDDFVLIAPTVPEPNTLLLAGMGMAGLSMLTWATRNVRT